MQFISDAQGICATRHRKDGRNADAAGHKNSLLCTFVEAEVIARFPMILVVGPGSDAKDAKDFVANAKAHPGTLNYGSAGAGSPHHLAMELLKVNAGLQMTHVPYKGIEPVGSTPAQFGELIQSETVRWPKLIKEQKISLD